jgi:hypothetical protein
MATPVRLPTKVVRTRAALYCTVEPKNPIRSLRGLLDHVKIGRQTITAAVATCTV